MTAGGRPYRSALRNEQSRATRRRIVDAGAALFVESGYVPTTIDAIAERAGVSRRTVFTSVGAKAAVLKLAFDWTLAGDEEPVAIADRPEVQRMMQGEDPAELLAAWMAMNAAINQRLATLYHVLVVAADADPEAATLLATTDDQRAEGARDVVGRVADLGGLPPGLEPEQAAAIADVLIDPTLYQRLVGTWGWTFETYVGHLQRMAAVSLLA
ncbi:TetR/AcrR family transcriptional regulator [Geodermatophilus sp. SYSU D00779]